MGQPPNTQIDGKSLPRPTALLDTVDLEALPGPRDEVPARLGTA